MIDLKDFLELVQDDPTGLPLTYPEYKELRAQEVIERKLMLQKLEVKFNDNPNKKTATALSNARNACVQTPVEIAWKNSPDYLKRKRELELEQREQMRDLVRTLNQFAS